MSKSICICVTGGETLDAEFDPRFGRARAFLITNEAGTSVKVVVNSDADASGGAGVAAASTMAKLQVTDVVAGHFGGKAEKGLAALSIGMHLAEEGQTAAQVLAKFCAGELKVQV